MEVIQHGIDDHNYYGINMDMSEDELQHWGIKGMKWGVRRYQNADGSLTEAGRKRYNQEVEELKAKKEKLEEREKNRRAQARMQARTDKLKAEIDELEGKKKKPEKPANDDPEAPKETGERKKRGFGKQDKPKKPEEMTAEELQEEINRMRNLQTYKQLYSQLNPPEVKRGKEAAEKLWKDGVLPAVTGSVKDVGQAFMSKMAKEALGLNQKSETEKLKAAYEKAKYKADKAKLEKEMRDLADEGLQKADRRTKIAKSMQELNKAKNGKSTEDLLKEYLDKSKDKYTQEEIDNIKNLIDDGGLWDILAGR